MIGRTNLITLEGKGPYQIQHGGESRGSNPSYSMNYQKAGHELMSVDELAVMDGEKCILQLRGVRPFLSDKYDLTKHPNYKETADFDKKNLFDIENYVNRRIKLKPDDEYDVIDIGQGKGGPPPVTYIMVKYLKTIYC